MLDEVGEPTPLERLWADRPVVLAFVRQFGCVLCRELVLQLRERAAEIRSAGADLVVVGNGSPESAARFRTMFELDLPVYVDPHRHVYEQLDFKRNLGGSAHPSVLGAAVRAWLRGFRQGRTEGDPWQLGGLLVIEPNGDIAFRHASRYAGDHAELDEVVQCVRGLSAGATPVRSGDTR